MEQLYVLHFGTLAAAIIQGDVMYSMDIYDNKIICKGPLRIYAPFFTGMPKLDAQTYALQS